MVENYLWMCVLGFGKFVDFFMSPLNIDALTEIFGFNPSLLTLFSTVGVPIFVVYTLVKWAVPT